MANRYNTFKISENTYTFVYKRNIIKPLLQDSIKYRKDLYLYKRINRGLTDKQIRDLDQIRSQRTKIIKGYDIKEQYYSKEINRIVTKYCNGNIITQLPKLKNGKIKKGLPSKSDYKKNILSR